VLELMMHGSFLKRSSSGAVYGDANTVVLFNPGEQFDIDHPVPQANTAVTIRIDAGVVPQWLPHAHRSRAHDVNRPFPTGDAPAASSAQLAAHVLVKRILRDDPRDPFEVEECVVNLIGALLQGDRANNRQRAIRKTPTGSSYHVLTAKEYLNAEFQSPVRLNDVADAAGCSSWHLSRLFTQETGLRMSAYLRRLRIRHALAALAHGCDDITRLALDLGFCSHSHFTAAFRREFGIPPRCAREQLSK
jgi:AraC-like DNA-binding protein